MASAVENPIVWSMQDRQVEVEVKSISRECPSDERASRSNGYGVPSGFRFVVEHEMEGRKGDGPIWQS